MLVFKRTLGKLLEQQLSEHCLDFTISFSLKWLEAKRGKTLTQFMPNMFFDFFSQALATTVTSGILQLSGSSA